jgi:RNA polymerase sigma-70 factor (sigma-E family)
MSATGGAMARHEGFDEFVATRSPALLRTAYLLTRDWAAAEDLVQTSLTKAWQAWGRLDDQPEAYVRKIVVNTFASSWRRRWRGEVPTAELPESASVAGDLEQRDVVWTALGRLPRRMRAVVVLRYYEDLSEAEIARILGISTGTVKSQCSKALAHLRIDPTLTPDSALETS